ncbi:MAG: polyphosphate kinase 2 family protein [Halothiobacillus sp.]|nr:polyphosphate kinase 2 family protein [Halothiobacillus sp.]
MDYRARFLVDPLKKLSLADNDPDDTGDIDKEKAAELTATYLQRMEEDQFLLYADGRQSLLVVLQALDAAGKDGVIRHVFSAMNPQGTRVHGFKQPTPLEAAHDFLWRAHAQVPAAGEVVIFNRSHYEDVLVVRVHDLVPREVWSQRYETINAFERLLAENGTRVLKFFLHISPDEQLERFKKRLDDPRRHWKISESDYSERKFWPQYIEAYEEALVKTSTLTAPWYVIPSDHKWFRNLAVSQIIAETLEEMGLELPPTRVNIDEIKLHYHAAVKAANGNGNGNGKKTT